MSRVAAEVRREKESHPDRFCQHERCLWRTATAQGYSPCKNHPVQPTPVAPSGESQPCNVCTRTVGMRVEVRTASERLVVCASCAADLASKHPQARIAPFTPSAISCFVASDGFYTPNPVAVAAHQRSLDAEAVRFAERVAAYVARQCPAVVPVVASRSTAEARASILARMTPKARAALALIRAS